MLLIAALSHSGAADELAEAYYQQARELYAEGPSRAREIIALLTKAIERDEEHLKAHHLLAITYFGTAQMERALAEFDRALEIAEEDGKTINAGLRFYRARTLFELDRCSEAKELLESHWAFWQDAGLLQQGYEALYPKVVARCGQARDTPSVYSKPEFGFSAAIPDEWRISAEREKNGELIVSFRLPSARGGVEQQDIGDSVSITAYRRDTFDDLTDLVAVETERMADTVVSREEIPSDIGRAFVVVTKTDGVQHKTLTTYHFTNGVGYVIAFTATEGIYDLNVGKYKRFLTQVSFVPPAEESP